eukprot:365106-Chlamydomonas_euryale.AAC.6
MTGGPGCSSSLAVFYENGPYSINDDLTLSETEYGWDVAHTVVFVDQPVGVGYSYTEDSRDAVYDEVAVGEDMLDFLTELMEVWRAGGENQVWAWQGGAVPLQTRPSDPMYQRISQKRCTAHPCCNAVTLIDFLHLAPSHTRAPGAPRALAEGFHSASAVAKRLSFPPHTNPYFHNPRHTAGSRASVAQRVRSAFGAHPELASRPLFVTGESYAGHYGPAVTHRVWRANKEAEAEGKGPVIKLGGMAIGNGLTSPGLQFTSYADFAVRTGILDPIVSGARGEREGIIDSIVSGARGEREGIIDPIVSGARGEGEGIIDSMGSGTRGEDDRPDLVTARGGSEGTCSAQS